ncbi:MAG: hydroxyacylglutathione hydrolase [Planktomarina sp.]
MPQLIIKTIPCLNDNYAFLIANPQTQNAAVVDVPEAAPINAALDAEGWTLTDVLLTHHHWDHVDGLPDLNGSPRVIGAAADAHRLPPLDVAVHEGDVITVLGQDMQILDVSGHTVGHIAFVMDGAAFTGDSLMAMGCGRLFEGDGPMMWDSLQKLRALPPHTVIHSGHEYTAGNIAFAQSLGENNAALTARAQQVAQARAKGQPTVPSTLALEIATNPFLRADDPALQQAVGMEGADAAQVFTHIRNLKDGF